MTEPHTVDLREMIVAAYAEHDRHREAYPDHRGACQDERPDPHWLARRLRVKLEDAHLEEPHDA